ncbi:MAG: hypothetical protein ABII06_04770 [Pseudomonadota bacterium]
MEATIYLAIIGVLFGLIIWLMQRSFSRIDEKLDFIQDNMVQKDDCLDRHKSIRENEGKIFDAIGNIQSDCAELKGRFFN